MIIEHLKEEIKKLEEAIEKVETEIRDYKDSLLTAQVGAMKLEKEAETMKYEVRLWRRRISEAEKKLTQLVQKKQKLEKELKRLLNINPSLRR